jgi:uncharacterized protein YggT (Ycf19 family)
MGALQVLGTLNLAHIIIQVIFVSLIVCMFARMILSFFPMISPANPFVRFFNAITGPLIDPIQQRLPRMTIGMFDLSLTIAFIFTWWALGILEFLATSALPAGW